MGKSLPYVVSEDTVTLLRAWGQQFGFEIPDDGFFTEMRSEMSRYMHSLFSEFVLLSEHILRTRVHQILSDFALPVISMDHAYCTSPYSISLTRAVTRNGHEWVDAGRVPREGCADLQSQVRDLANRMQGDVVLFDDVIFEGRCMGEVIVALRAVGIDVRVAVAAVGVGTTGVDGGIHTISKLVEQIVCVETFPEVVDEICERDLYGGVPHSGRTILTKSGHRGAPYFLPFGCPIRWASIPENDAGSFSRFHLSQTLRLWTEIGKCSGKTIRCGDVPRPFTPDEWSELPIADALGQYV